MSYDGNGQLIEFTNAAGLPTEVHLRQQGGSPPAKIPCMAAKYSPSFRYRTDVDTPALANPGERVDAWGSPTPGPFPAEG